MRNQDGINLSKLKTCTKIYKNKCRTKYAPRQLITATAVLLYKLNIYLLWRVALAGVSSTDVC